MARTTKAELSDKADRLQKQLSDLQDINIDLKLEMEKLKDVLAGWQKRAQSAERQVVRLLENIETLVRLGK